jgi:hypothetical protein
MGQVVDGSTVRFHLLRCPFAMPQIPVACQRHHHDSTNFNLKNFVVSPENPFGVTDQ